MESAYLEKGEVFTKMKTSPGGLSKTDAEERLIKHGPNTVAMEKQRGWLWRLFKATRNLLVILLAILATVSFATGDFSGGTVMTLMLMLGVALRFVQESRADAAAAKLKAMISVTAAVVRDGQEEEIPLKELVPGDVINLCAGVAEPSQMIPELSDKPHTNTIKILGWWLHIYQSKPSFSGAEITGCYDRLHFSKPNALGPYGRTLVLKKELLPAGKAKYKLESKVREKLNKASGQSATTIAVTDLLVSLAATIPDMAEREYYKEALICYRLGSPRAAVVMTWNIAYSHLCDYILANKLADFNAQWQSSNPGKHKKKVLNIVNFDDFNEYLKEYQVLTICKDAGIITRNIFNVMDPGLKKRNAAAHPNPVVASQVQADAFIQDMIVNVVQKIK